MASSVSRHLGPSGLPAVSRGEKFPRKPNNKRVFIDQAFSAKMHGWILASFFFDLFFFRVYRPRIRLGPSTRKKGTWPISSHLDRKSLLNNPYILPVFLRVTLFLLSGLISGCNPFYNAGRSFFREVIQLFLFFWGHRHYYYEFSRIRHEELTLDLLSRVAGSSCRPLTSFWQQSTRYCIVTILLPLETRKVVRGNTSSRSSAAPYSTDYRDN